MKVSVSEYLKIAQRNQIIPNFFLSEPYLSISEAEAIKDFNWIWIEENNVCLFPPLPINPDRASDCPISFIWSDFINLKGWGSGHFLDWEYVYDPNNFLNLGGKKWSTFRKNIRKWPSRNNENWSYGRGICRDQLIPLLINWLENKKKTAQEPEIIAKYLLNSDNEINLKSLFLKDKLMGVNAWDENYCYINYRYCLVQQDEPFLDEFCRYLFYSDLEIIKSSKLVNDGGSLGNPALEKFKDKLNPVIKRRVYSWMRKIFST